MHLSGKLAALGACLCLMLPLALRAEESVQVPAPSLDGASPAATLRAAGLPAAAEPVYASPQAARAAAERGEAAAQFQLGRALQDEQRLDEARQWYERAAAQDHPAAIHRLARLYEKGEGVAADPQKGFELSLKAAQLGWAEAMWDVANSYGAGRVAPRDLLSACTWILRAREHAGDDKPEISEQARQVLPYLERALSLEQVAACRKQASVWPPTSAQAVQPEIPSGPVAGVAGAGATRMVAKYVTVVRNGKKVRTKVMVAVRDSGRHEVAARGGAGKRVVAAKGGKPAKVAAKAAGAGKSAAGGSKRRVAVAHR